MKARHVVACVFVVCLTVAFVAEPTMIAALLQTLGAVAAVVFVLVLILLAS